MSNICKERHASLGRMVLRLFPKVMQMILKDYITPKGLQKRFSKNDFRLVFSENELVLMEMLPNIDYFTVEISYKILRYEFNMLHEPKCKWGNVPHFTEVEIADDIQRLINATNTIIKINTEEVTAQYSEKMLEEIKCMVTRIDSYLEQDDLRNLYSSLCRSETDSSSILQDLTSIKAIGESLPDTEKDERERYSRLSIPIIDIFPKILRNVIRKCEPVPKCLHQKCVPVLTTFYPEQQRIIKELQYSNKYDSLDVTISYRLLQQFSLIPSPTKGWGKFPDKVDINLGDDVERICRYRNTIAHRSDTRIKKNEFDKYFNEFRSIGIRMDLNFSRTTNYEQEIDGCRTCVIDTAMQAKYENSMMRIENIKLRFEERPIKFYWGDDFDTWLRNLRSLLRNEKLKERKNIRLQIIFQNEEDIEKSKDILNSLTEEINEGLCNIEFIVATKARFEKEPIKIYWGDNFDVMHLKSLLNQGKEEGKENINVQIVFQNKEAIEKCKTILKALQEEENMDISRVDFIFAEEGLRKTLHMQLPWLVDADEFQRMLSDGEYLSYENRLSLGGPCRVGKSALASVLIGTEIPQTWNSTNGLVIYFGRNGIDIEKKKMVPLKEDKRDDVLEKILRGRPNVQKKSEQIISQKTTTHDFRTKHAVDEFAIQTCTSISGSVHEHTHTRMSDRTRYSAIHEMQLSKRPKLELKSDILEEVRKGQYRIEIAPSDLIDFGGQKSYDMTHQLFIQHSGSFLLMFDGRFGLYDQLNEYPLGVTAASILIHWVDSILTYSEDTEDIMPMILFAATHRDLCQGDTAKMKESFISSIKQIFSNYEQSHMYLDTVYFINSKDEHDKEIQHMTDQVVTFAMKQSSWGQRRPMQWVPLELQISNIRMKNVNIITKEDLYTVNALNDDLALTDTQLDDFLLVQHSLGKLIYYNIPRLNDFVIIHPPVLVNILRSFVTHEMFFPEDENLKSILQTLTEVGKIYKTDLLKLWDQNEYIQNDAIKEFVIELLVQLNILIIPETFKSNRSSAELFFVPCMIKTIKPSNYIDFENQREKTICLKYVLSRQSIPSSLAYTIIGTTLHVWPLKEEGNLSCIYDKAVILNVVDNNELRLWVEDNMIIVYITNQTSLLAISPDITASIQECLTRNLESTFELYYKSFGGQLKHAKLSKLFSMEVGIPCGNSVCYIQLEKAKTVESWKCKNGEEHMTRNLLYWIFDRVPETCKPECKGKTNEDLNIEPSDKHLARFGNNFGYESFEDYFIHLGMKKLTLKKIKDKYHVFGSGGIISIALIRWKESKLSGKEKPTMKNLSDALVASALDSHLMCQMFREDTKLLDDANPNLQKTPTDKALTYLSKQIGNCVFELGIELGLTNAEIEQILFKNHHLPGLIEEILLKWKRTSKVETVRNLLMALERVEKGGFNCLTNMLKDSTMFEEKAYVKDFYKKTKNQTGLALIVNYSVNRQGSDEDVRRLENFFLKELRYKVKCEHNLQKSDLMDTIDSFKTEEMTGKPGTRYHCFVLVIMCHGKEDKLSLWGEDHVKIKEIVDKFKLSDFAGKPKFFIFQTCREGLEQSYRHAADDSDARGQLHSDDKPLSEKLHEDSDILLSFATTPGYQAYRKVPHAENQWIGSWFIHALLDVFEKNYKDIDVMKMLEKVRGNLNAKADYRPQGGKCQMSEDVSTLTKTFFL